MKENILLSVISLLILIVIQLLSANFANVDTFFKSPIGMLIITLLISGVFIPQIEPVLKFRFKKYYISRLYKELETLVKQKKGLDSYLHKKIFKRLFSSKKLTQDYLDSLSNDEAGLFILGLQFYYHELDVPQNFDLFDVIRLAEKAASFPDYKILLLAMSLNYFRPDADTYALAENLFSKASGFIKVRYKSEDADNKFFERLERASNERIYIFSTTSQVSNFSFDLIRHSHNAQNIEELNLFMVSPLIKTDIAILELLKEYKLPNYAIPKGQFINDNIYFDIVRRVLKILMAIEMTQQFKKDTGIPINMYFFKERYPEIKICLMENRTYLQLLPGCLKYANNIYRFGIEIMDKDVIDEFLVCIKNMIKNKNQIEKIELNDIYIEDLRNQALKEAYWYLVENSQNIQDLENYRPIFQVILKNPQTNTYINKIMELDYGVRQYIEGYNFATPAKLAPKNDEIVLKSDVLNSPNNLVIKNLVNNHQAHVSVGILFLKDGKIFMIKKKKHPYQDKWSIVAGHLENGESARIAIKREVKEELGITINNFHFIKYYDNIPGDICRYKFHYHIWYLFICDDQLNENAIILSQEEILDYSWLKYEDLSQVNNFTVASSYILGDLGLV
jgi:8-oxo-dGTP pyrophosphatase MutT (NUDIX family)